MKTIVDRLASSSLTSLIKISRHVHQYFGDTHFHKLEQRTRDPGHNYHFHTFRQWLYEARPFQSHLLCITVEIDEFQLPTNEKKHERLIDVDDRQWR